MTTTFDYSDSYNYALLEAVAFIREHKNDKDFPIELPREIVEKAIGPEPPCCDPQNIDTSKDSFYAYSLYLHNANIFLKEALKLCSQ